jgi:hypothetical protein
LKGQKKLAITRELWTQYILPPSFLHYRCMMIIGLCIEDQNGDRVVYRWGTHVPFGLLFAEYMSNEVIQPIGGLFLSHERRIRQSEMPKGLGFDTGYHVIMFVNLLTFIDQNELEYQVKYPLTRGNEREGVLDEHTMRDVIDALIERGHVVEIVFEGDEVTPQQMNATAYKKGKSVIFYQWSLYTAHNNTGIIFGDHSKMEVLFEIKTIC